jgi:hypothetical protein
MVRLIRARHMVTDAAKLHGAVEVECIFDSMRDKTMNIQNSKSHLAEVRKRRFLLASIAFTGAA